jgi:hypothetical protein
VRNGVAFGADQSKWSFAWALHAGLGVKVTPTMTVELAYSYLNLGDAESGDLITYLGANAVYNPMQFKSITSHDVKLGVRWTCCDTTPAPPPRPQMVYQQPAPLYQPQQPVYQQPPVYQQQQQLYVPPPAYPPGPGYAPPPLMRKG